MEKLVKEVAERMGITITSTGVNESVILTQGDKTVRLPNLELLDSDFNITPKLETAKACQKHNISHVSCTAFPQEVDEAICMGLEILKQEELFVLRGNTGFSANNTFFIRSEEELRNGLVHLNKNGVLALYSPFEREAHIEYRVMWLNGLVFAVKKFRNAHGFHNLSKGARATCEGDFEKLRRLHEFSKTITDTLGIRSAGIDIFDTPSGFKLLELSIPNIGKFSKMSDEHHQLSQHFIEKALLHFLNKK